MLRRLVYSIVVSAITWTTMLGQTQNITGRVTDSDGNPLVGVTVVISETTKGVVTDLDGTYTIEAEVGDELNFSFVGMQPKSFTVSPETTTINVTLTEDVTAMEEVLVVGYGTQKKESKVAAIVQVEGDEITRSIGGSNLSNSLNGYLPGLVTIRYNGMPGGGTLTGGEPTGQYTDSRPSQIFIRGQTTWNGGEPLILVDGVERNMNEVDPNEVQTISVLKDASATAVFGVKGADGVILITTKRGSVQKPKLSYESIVTGKRLSEIPNTLNSYDVNHMRNQAIEHGLVADGPIWDAYTPWEVLQYYKTQEYPELYPDVDWAEETTREVGVSHRHNLNVTGGTDFVKYFLSLGYLNEGDIFKAEDMGQGYKPDFNYQRYNFRSNLDFKLTETTEFALNLSALHGRVQRPGIGNSLNVYSSVYGNAPDLFPVRYSDGMIGYANIQTQMRNPVHELNYYGITRGNRSELNADFILTQKLDFITKGLSVKGRLSTDNHYYSWGPNYAWDKDGTVTKYIDPGILNAETAEDSAKYITYTYPQSYSESAHGYNYLDLPNYNSVEGIQNSSLYRSLYYEFALNYAREFGRNELTGLILFNRREHTTGSDFTSYREDWVGRVTYSYDRRYFLEFNGAYNGSEKFDREYRFGFFPSVAAGWMLSNETFFESALPFFNIFKLRYSYGQVGNDAGIARWQYVSVWNKRNHGKPFGHPFTQDRFDLYFEEKIANPDLHWEVATKNNIALESGIFNNLFTLNFDYFWEHRTDMFIAGSQRTNTVIFGGPLPSANLGEAKSWGWEMELGFSKAFSNSRIWSKLSWARVQDEVIFRDDPPLRPDYQKNEGFSIGQMTSYVNTGIISSWNDLYTGVVGENNQLLLPGDYRLMDFNADGVINADDVVPYGYSRRPEYQYSFSVGFSYKSLSLSARIFGVYNVSGSPQDIAFMEFNQNKHVAFDYHRDESWSPEAGRTSQDLYPHVRYNFQSNKGHYFIWDMSYLRLQNAELSYGFTGSNMERIGIDNLRVFLLANNILLWNKIPVDVDQPNYPPNYPMTYSMSLGVNLGF